MKLNEYLCSRNLKQINYELFNFVPQYVCQNE